MAFDIAFPGFLFELSVEEVWSEKDAFALVLVDGLRHHGDRVRAWVGRGCGGLDPRDVPTLGVLPAIPAPSWP